MLAVAKAATGTARHAERATRAVQNALDTLDGHHGSSSGNTKNLIDTFACMGGNTKGKGGGKGERETYEQKDKRLAKEISDSCKAHDQQSLTTLWRVQAQHWRSAETRDWGTARNSGRGSRPRGRSQSPAGVRTKTKARARSSSAGSNASKSSKSSTASTASAKQRKLKLLKEKRAQKAEEKKRAKENRQSAADEPKGAEPRPTRLCAQCFYSATYITSVKCFSCKRPFPTCTAFVAPAPAPADAVTPPAPSPACDTAMATLQQLSATSKAREATYLEAAKRGERTVTIVAPGEKPPPPPPPPMPAPTAGSNAAQLAQPVTPAVILVDEDERAAAASTAELTSLNAKREALQKQILAWAGTPLEAAMKDHAKELDIQIKKLMDARQLALEPHQVEELLSQCRAELALAMQAEAAAETTTKAQLETFRTRADATDEAYKKEIKDLLAAHEASQKMMLEERASLVKTTDELQAAAKERVAAIRARIDAAQAQVAAAAPAVGQAPPQDSAHASASACPAVSVEAQKQATMVHQQQVDALTAQLEEAKRNLQFQAAAKSAELEETRKAMQRQVDATALELQQQKEATAAADTKAKRVCANAAAAAKARKAPTTLLPPAVLPRPAAPICEKAVQSLCVLRNALRMLAMQETPVPFTWADMGAAKLSWEEFCTLVPPLVTADSIPGLDHTAGPPAADQIPRRILECLRTQLDTIAVEWETKNAAEAMMADVRAQATAFATQMLDQAKRIQERKRCAEPAENAEEAPAPKAAAPDDTALEVQAAPDAQEGTTAYTQWPL